MCFAQDQPCRLSGSRQPGAERAQPGLAPGVGTRLQAAPAGVGTPSLVAVSRRSGTVPGMGTPKALRSLLARRRARQRRIRIGTSDVDRFAFLKFSTVVVVRAGRRLVRAGEPGREVLMVLGGVASVHAAGSGQYLGTVADGELCGELAILDGGVRRADVVANTDVLVAAMTPAEFVSWMSIDATFAELVSTQASAHRGD